MDYTNAIQYLPSKVNQDFFRLYDQFDKVILSGSGNISSKSFLVSDFYRYEKAKNLVWIVNDISEKETHKKMLQFWSNHEIIDFELEENGFNDREVTRRNNGLILNLIGKLSDPQKRIVLATYQDILTLAPKKEDIQEESVKFSKGDKYSLVQIFEKLIDINLHTAKDFHVNKGEYYCRGNIITVFPYNLDFPIRLSVDFDEITEIHCTDVAQKEITASLDEITIAPILEPVAESYLNQYIEENTIFIEDELEVIDEYFDGWELFTEKIKAKKISFQTFNEDEFNHKNLQYVSTLQFHTIHDFTTELQDKKKDNWKVIIFTKHFQEIKNILDEKNVIHFTDKNAFQKKDAGLLLVEIDKDISLPLPFQNPNLKLSVITDKDIVYLNKDAKQQKNNQKVYLDLLTSLKINDLVVHADHGVARFLGLDKKTVDQITKEYLKLGYAENDKLFVPIDQADKVSKYIGAEELAPKLTRLGSAEWVTVTNKVKAETQKIAKELLKLYAARKAARGVRFELDSKEQDLFEESFGYEPTPGQIKAIIDVKKDMESELPMDRLVCGDVGFGKTEVAIRAAFKAAKSGKQVAFISPITILADQHYRSFKERMDKFHIRVEMISRFKSKAEQKDILKRLEKGEVDIIIGTHRLIQADVKFKDLGLIIIDEEQRFGVQQKEKLKEMRTEVDVLTLTATPIPRTLNICLNKLRDISTITTPPPGRLPVITEVRKYSDELIRDAIQRELDRGGQVYFLHNKVQTIDSVAVKLKQLLPHANFVVAHGKLSATELEKRIIGFKNKDYDVLVSSTIIENGIDLPNANTLIVNSAERFGLAQLYQLRGRVGRGRAQAYAYFLYHGQRLKLDAKKRLRAIVEASELGSGFQIAMKDLEIRGAGEILGANQSGAMNVVGVSHFIRMLNKAVEDLQAGKTSETEEIQEVSIELPINAYIPDNYIVNSKDKINFYQKLSSADTTEYLKEIEEELEEEFGRLPNEVSNLFRVIELKIYAKIANLINVKAENSPITKSGKMIVLTMSEKIRPENIMNMLDYNDKWQISGNKLKIALEDLGAHWFTTLTESIQALGVKKEVK
jgi:transcription-repair coupling factor